MNRQNPFPGINPWMQSSWSDVHTMLISYIRDALSDELPDDLVVRAEENLSVNARRRRADVAERWVEIRSANGDLIAVIEVLSPSNKTQHDHLDFETKVRRFLQAGVSVMEIDLIRGGLGACDVRPGDWPPERYQIVVTRPGRSHHEVYPCPLRQPLPAVRVPLRDDEPDAALDLQPLIDRCYTRGRYWTLDYAVNLNPPLPEDDAIWANERLQEAGLL